MSHFRDVQYNALLRTRKAIFSFEHSFSIVTRDIGKFVPQSVDRNDLTLLVFSLNDRMNGSYKDKTFLLLLQVCWHQVMKEHDELSVHGDTDVVGEFCHNTALHFGFAVRVWNKFKKTPRS